MIVFNNVSKQYGGTQILENASFSLSEKDRTGFIGANGSGKTTLLRMLCAEEEPDRGLIEKPSAFTIGYLPQEVEIFDGKTALEIVLSPFKSILSYETQLHTIIDKAPDASGSETLQQIDALHTAMELHDGYSLEARAKSILNGLGISSRQWSQPIQQLSGGYRMRAVLGQLLLLSPDFLLLDEPTNHLDMDSLVWLEKYLLRIKSGMLIVSHDRDFLNRITTCTAEISGGTIATANGNYDHFINSREEIEANAASRAKNIAAQIAQNERFVERFKSKASKATQAQSRMKLLEKLRAEMPALPPHQRQQRIRFSFPSPSASGTVPLQLNGVTAGYGTVKIIENLSLSINRGDKIAIVGPNGSGKTTLLKLLAGILLPQEGTITQGNNTIIRYFGQHQLDQLHPELTLYDTVIRDSVNTEKTFIRNILGSFLFSGDAVDKKAGVLSGGEKARLVLATILASPGNVLLLDEPTNHLDINSVEMLADAMASFSGTIAFVSHDEYFISRIATRIIEMRPCLVRDYPGSLADYRYYLETVYSEQLQDEPGKKPSPENVAFDDDKNERIRIRDQRKRLQRSIEKFERSIEALETQISTLQTILHDPANASDHSLLHRTTLEFDDSQAVLEKLISEWEEKQSELESIETILKG